MSHNVYIYILVMAGVTYLVRMLPLALIQKDHKSFCEIISVLRALRLPRGDDVPRDPHVNRKYGLRHRRLCRGADRGL